jgi:hypothetical protein
MKLRIRGNSIRLRLTQAEVAALAEHGHVDESVSFVGGQMLIYALVCSDVGSRPRSTLTTTNFGARIEITVSADDVRKWAASQETVALESSEVLTTGDALRILVEKDFACLTERPHEDDADAFPNPKASC